MTITKTIKGIIKQWNLKPHDINNGQCEEFAMEVIQKMGGYKDNLTEVCTENYVNFGEMMGHVWILYNGKHYDAESAIGIKNWRKLPIFKNNIGEK